MTSLTPGEYAAAHQTMLSIENGALKGKDSVLDHSEHNGQLYVVLRSGYTLRISGHGVISAKAVSARHLSEIGVKNVCVIDDVTNAQEADPSGISPHTPGAKLDAGKNRLGLVLQGFANALEEVGRVGTFGANKYTDNGWMSVPNGHARYTDAAYRHLLKEAQGELLDPDSGLQHAAHAAWNALARLELKLRETK